MRWGHGNVGTVTNLVPIGFLRFESTESLTIRLEQVRFNVYVILVRVELAQ